MPSINTNSQIGFTKSRGPRSAGTALIELEGIVRSFGSLRAVDGVGLTVARGEIVGLLGPNGAGKSTTLRIAAGYLDADAGRVRIAGHDLASARIAAQHELGYLAEGAPGYETLSARELLTFVGRARGFAKADIAARIDALTAQLELGAHLDTRFERLSKGFRRRVSLAAALFADPPALILDEPTDGLDPNQKRALRQHLIGLAHTKAILISTHILEEVPAVCDRVLVMARGQLVFQGTPAELAERGGDGPQAERFERAFAEVTL